MSVTIRQFGLTCIHTAPDSSGSLVYYKIQCPAICALKWHRKLEQICHENLLLQFNYDHFRANHKNFENMIISYDQNENDLKSLLLVIYRIFWELLNNVIGWNSSLTRLKRFWLANDYPFSRITDHYWSVQCVESIFILFTELYMRLCITCCSMYRQSSVILHFNVNDDHSIAIC